MAAYLWIVLIHDPGFIPYKPTTPKARGAQPAVETSFLEAADHASRHPCTTFCSRGFASSIEEFSVAFKDAENLLVKYQRIEVTG